MGLKERISADIDRIFVKEDQFATTHYWNGKQGIGAAGGVGYGAVAAARPGLFPGNNPLLQLLNHAVRDFFVDVFHGVGLLK